MMTQTPSRWGLYARGEAGTRTIVILVGAGVMAFTFGGLLVSWLMGWFPGLGSIDHPTTAFVLGWAVQRLWLWIVLPGLGFVAGRMMKVSPRTFALTAGLTGELYGVLLTSAGSGLEAAFLDWVDVVARVVTLGAGLGWTAFAVAQGRRGAQDAQARADAVAAQNAAEYAEMMARARGEPPPEPPASP